MLTKTDPFPLLLGGHVTRACMSAHGSANQPLPPPTHAHLGHPPPH